LIAAMLHEKPQASDLIFSPGRAPQVEVRGDLVALPFEGFERLTAQQIVGIAEDLIGTIATPPSSLTKDGSTDLAYSLPGIARFRVNVFRQRATCAIVMRVIPMSIPTFADLHLPQQLAENRQHPQRRRARDGPTGSGKSSTLAAIIDLMNQQRAIHIVTIEDPIEFLHEHKKATITSASCTATRRRSRWRCARRCGRRRKSFWSARCATARRSRSRSRRPRPATSCCRRCTPSTPSKTVERIVGAFPLGDQAAIRSRFSKSFKFVVSQRLVPRADGNGRLPVLEILKSTLRTREYVDKGETEGKTLLDAMRDGKQDGMQHFDGEIEKLIRITRGHARRRHEYATNPNNLRLEIADFVDQLREEEKKAVKA
jgi:twitching motility protein PilT